MGTHPIFESDFDCLTEMSVSNNELCNLAYEGKTALFMIRKDEEPNLLNRVDSSGRTPLHWACASRQIDIVKEIVNDELIDIKDDMGWTALHCACSSGAESIVALLCERGASVNAKTQNGQVPMHYVASKNNLAILPLLLQYGARLNQQDKYGYSPLHRAASRGYEKMVEGLLSAGALVDPKDNQGNTPLHMACEEDRLTTAFILLEQGQADPSELNHDEKTPFQMASDALRLKLKSQKSRR